MRQDDRQPFAPYRQLHPRETAGAETPPFPGEPLIPVLERIAANTAAMLEALRRPDGAPLYDLPSIQ